MAANDDDGPENGQIRLRGTGYRRLEPERSDCWVTTNLLRRELLSVLLRLRSKLLPHLLANRLDAARSDQPSRTYVNPLSERILPKGRPSLYQWSRTTGRKASLRMNALSRAAWCA